MKKIAIGIFMLISIIAQGRDETVENIKSSFEGYSYHKKKDVVQLKDDVYGNMAFIGFKKFDSGNLVNFLGNSGFNEIRTNYYKNSAGEIGFIGSKDNVQYFLLAKDSVGLADMREKIEKAFTTSTEDLQRGMDTEEGWVPDERVRSEIVLHSPGTQPKGEPKEIKAPAIIKSKAKSGQHTVVKGDTLYNISRRYGLSVDQLRKKNNIKDNHIKLGQQLVY